MKNYMDNDTIVKSICQLENIDLTNFHPMTEWGEPSDVTFDLNFPIDRIYFWQGNNYKKRIRFVNYHNEYVTLYLRTLRVSHITKTQRLNENACYFLENEKHISFKEIERTFKFKQIMKKMGR
jgi:hypothetical protein